MPLLKELNESENCPDSYKHSAPTGPAQTFRTSGGRAVRATAHNAPRAQSDWRALPDEGSAFAPSHHDLLFTKITKPMIGFDRSAFAASPDLSGFSNQNVNRVNARFMTKVFRSFLSKFRTRKALCFPVVLITQTNLSKAFPERASPVRYLAHSLNQSSHGRKQV
jgi:hypothetical protein